MRTKENILDKIQLMSHLNTFSDTTNILLRNILEVLLDIRDRLPVNNSSSAINYLETH